FIPIRFCLKNTGPLESIFIIKDNIKNNGDKIIIAINESMKSIFLFDFKYTFNSLLKIYFLLSQVLKSLSYALGLLTKLSSRSLISLSFSRLVMNLFISEIG